MNWKHLPIVIGAATLMAAGQAFAQTGQAQPGHGENLEISAPSRTLKTCYFKTQDNLLPINTILTDAFTPTSVFCPATGTCTVEVQVSSQIWAVDPGTVARMNVKVDGGAASPASLVNVDSTSTGPWANTRTFQWIKTGLGSGLFGAFHSVDVEMSVSGGAANGGYRSLRICVYKP
jgi:hypothetical protein